MIAAVIAARCSTPGVFSTYLLFLNDIDAGLDIGESMHGGEDGLSLVLFIEFTPRSPTLGEGCGVHEAPQVKVLLKVCQSVFHLIVVKEGFHISDLDIRLERNGSVFLSYYS